MVKKLTAGILAGLREPMWKMNYPQDYKFIDATPDDDYPLRILKAYRKDCDFRWSSTTNASATEVTVGPLMQALNEVQQKRAEILDRAIRILEERKL